MSLPVLEFGSSHFAEARRCDRTAAINTRRAAESAALAALHTARQRFADHAAEVYVDGALAAFEDCGVLDEIADRLVAAMEDLEPVFARLDVARDQALYRGPVMSRARSPYDPVRLAGLAAETLAEALLSDPAAAVLAASMGRRAPGRADAAEPPADRP